MKRNLTDVIMKRSDRFASQDHKSSSLWNCDVSYFSLNEGKSLESTFNNGFYRIEHNADNHTDSIICADGSKINRNKVQNWYKLKNTKEIPLSKGCTEKQTQARLEAGKPLERANQSAWRMNNISFEGNPLNEHFAHSQAQIVDLETEVIPIINKKIFVECTNPKVYVDSDHKGTHLNKESMNEKIQYFHRIDPQHEGIWILTISSLKCVDQETIVKLQTDHIIVVEIGTTVSNHNANNIDTKLSIIYSNIIANTPIDIRNLNTNRDTNETDNSVYLLHNYTPIVQNKEGVVHILNNNKLEVGDLEPLIAV